MLLVLCGSEAFGGVLERFRLLTFAELVSDAQLIARVRVSAVKTWDVQMSSEHHITISVTFSVLKTLKGDSSSTLVLELPGESPNVAIYKAVRVPVFEKGDEDYLFINPKAESCSIVGRAYGRIRVLATREGVVYVARDDRAPIGNVSDLAAPMEGAFWTPHEAVLSPTEFEREIETELAHPSPRALHTESELFNLPMRHAKKDPVLNLGKD